MKRIFFLILFSIATSAFASKEGILAFSEFRLESPGIGSSGKVVIEGHQNEKAQIVALKRNACGTNYIIPKEMLAKLTDITSNGIRISYEHGYPELGGRTIYIQLQMGFTSFVRKEALITLTENGKVEVSDVQTKEEPK